MRALRDGTVQAEGIQLNYITLPPEEIFWRMLKYREFDASEMSLGNHIMATARGTSRFVAVPVFPSRLFRHSFIFINMHSRIAKPQDLAGKRVGAPEYHITALVWMRGMLEHEYGVRPHDVHWVLAGLETPGREDRIEFRMPEGISWESRSDRTLSAMLDSGEVDAVISARAPSCFVHGSPRVARLFEDYAVVEMNYYRRTRLFPIMHTLVIRDDVYAQHPWVAQSLLKACEQAKTLALEHLWSTDTLKYMIPWLIPVLEQQREIFGQDCWPYGVEANRHTIETLIRYSHEQRLIPRPVEVDELFAPSTLAGFRL
jgi:4,5-dihydroxyphthalate decarboxylase